MCLSCSLAIAASPLRSCRTMTTVYEGRGAAVSRTLERNRPDLVLDRPRTYSRKRGHPHRRTRSRSSERDRALPLRVRQPLERGVAAISACHLSLSQPWFSQHRARGWTNDSDDRGRFRPHCPRRAPRPPVGPKDKADPAGQSRSMAGARRPRPSRRWAKAIFDDDLRSLQPVAPITRKRAGIATAGPALETPPGCLLGCAAQPAKPTFALGFLTGREINWLPEGLLIEDYLKRSGLDYHSGSRSRQHHTRDVHDRLNRRRCTAARLFK